MSATMSSKKVGVLFAAAFALIVSAPAAAQAATTENSPVESSQASTPVASDSDVQYVSIAEAEEYFGYDPEAPESSDIGDDSGPVVTPLWSWWGCDWRGVADYPHVTNGEASVHGYWVKDGGTCPATGTVTVELQALGCSSLLGCSWITQATSTVEGVTPGSGTGHWATPHKACANSNVVGWRGRVDTALTDFYDPFGWDDGGQKDLNCSPA